MDVFRDFNNCYDPIDLSGTNNPKPWGNNPFNDITIHDELKAIEYVYCNGFMIGTSASTFSPNSTVSRAQTAVILYTMAGNPDVSGLTIPFTDVFSNDYYYNAVRWAYNNGVMSGISGTLFSPNSSITREMAAVVFKKLAQYLNYSFSNLRTMYAFVDYSSISSWARTAVEEMYRACIFDYDYEDEFGNPLFVPSDVLTRKDIAVIIRRFDTIHLFG